MEYQHDPERIAARLKFDLERGKEMISGAAQDSTDIHAWEIFLRDRRISTIIELGTGTGAFSLRLRDKAPNFLTLDNKEPYHDIEEFISYDILNDPDDMIKEEINSASRPFLLYCDNGNKQQEVAMYSKILNKGDYLATHDFQIEIYPEDIPENFKLIINKGLTAFYVKT